MDLPSPLIDEVLRPRAARNGNSLTPFLVLRLPILSEFCNGAQVWVVVIIKEEDCCASEAICVFVCVK